MKVFECCRCCDHSRDTVKPVHLFPCPTHQSWFEKKPKKGA